MQQSPHWFQAQRKVQQQDTAEVHHAPSVISHCLPREHLALCSFRFTERAPQHAWASSEVPWDMVGSGPASLPLEILQKSSSGESILPLGVTFLPEAGAAVSPSSCSSCSQLVCALLGGGPFCLNIGLADT